jgi:hypothetical protein
MSMDNLHTVLTEYPRAARFLQRCANLDMDGAQTKQAILRDAADPGHAREWEQVFHKLAAHCRRMKRKRAAMVKHIPVAAVKRAEGPVPTGANYYSQAHRPQHAGMPQVVTNRTPPDPGPEVSPFHVTPATVPAQRGAITEVAGPNHSFANFRGATTPQGAAQRARSTPVTAQATTPQNMEFRDYHAFVKGVSERDGLDTTPLPVSGGQSRLVGEQDRTTGRVYYGTRVNPDGSRVPVHSATALPGDMAARGPWYVAQGRYAPPLFQSQTQDTATRSRENAVLADPVHQVLNGTKAEWDHYRQSPGANPYLNYQAAYLQHPSVKGIGAASLGLLTGGVGNMLGWLPALGTARTAGTALTGGAGTAALTLAQKARGLVGQSVAWGLGPLMVSNAYQRANGTEAAETADKQVRKKQLQLDQSAHTQGTRQHWRDTVTANPELFNAIPEDMKALAERELQAIANQALPEDTKAEREAQVWQRLSAIGSHNLQLPRATPAQEPAPAPQSPGSAWSQLATAGTAAVGTPEAAGERATPPAATPPPATLTPEREAAFAVERRKLRGHPYTPERRDADLAELQSKYEAELAGQPAQPLGTSPHVDLQNAAATGINSKDPAEQAAAVKHVQDNAPAAAKQSLMSKYNITPEVADAYLQKITVDGKIPPEALQEKNVQDYMKTLTKPGEDPFTNIQNWWSSADSTSRMLVMAGLPLGLISLLAGLLGNGGGGSAALGGLGLAAGAYGLARSGALHGTQFEGMGQSLRNLAAPLEGRIANAMMTPEQRKQFWTAYQNRNTKLIGPIIRAQVQQKAPQLALRSEADWVNYAQHIQRPDTAP